MQTATNSNGLTIINFGIGSANAATIMDLLVARNPKGVLFLGKMWWTQALDGDRKHFHPAHRRHSRYEGTSDELPARSEVPALPSFKLHKFVSEKIAAHQQEYRTGVIYTTNRRIWEWDEEFKLRLHKLSVIGIDMETATVFIVGHVNQIPRGALLLVTDVPMIPEGVKTDASDRQVTQQFVELHLEIGIEAMAEIEEKGEETKHFTY